MTKSPNPAASSVPSTPEALNPLEFSGSYTAVTRARSLVEAHLDLHGIQVRADGGLQRHVDPAADLKALLRRKPINDKILLDEIVEFSSQANSGLSTSALARNVRQVIVDRKCERRACILERLIAADLSAEEKLRAEEHFSRLAEVFEGDTELIVAGLKQFMSVTKRKQVGKAVEYPLMVIVTNKIQGSGKSELVLRLTKPLAELASDPVPFSEVADSRSRDLFSHAVVNIDDAGRMPNSGVADLKSAITVLSKQNRVLGTSRQQRFENLATFIATTNEDILALVPDQTGHRRFLALSMKNGAVEKGGSADVWEAINSLDFELMWRSVPVEGEEPIKPFLSQLHAYQARYVPPDPILSWLIKLDPASDAVRNITGPAGIGASKLYALFSDQTGIEMTNTAFGTAMGRFIASQAPGIPFIARRRTDLGLFYVLRQAVAQT